MAASTRLELREVVNELREVTDSYSLGLQLEVKEATLKQIERDYHGDAERRKTEIVSYWLRNASNPSWKVLAKALEDMPGGHKRLAERLKRKTVTDGDTLEGGQPHSLPFQDDEESHNGVLPLTNGFSTHDADNLYDRYKCEPPPFRSSKMCDKYMLEVKTDAIMLKFGALVTNVKLAMEKQGITIQIFADHLQEIRGLKPVHTHAQQPLLDACIAEVRVQRSLGAGFKAISGYYSWFNHQLIDNIIETFCKGNKDIAERQAEFKVMFKDYLRHRISKCPKSGYGFGRKQDARSIILKVDEKWNTVTVEQAVYIKITLGEILDCQEISLYLRSAENGCVQLTFLVPEFVADGVFRAPRLSQEQEQALVEAHVLELHCGSFSFHSTQRCPKALAVSNQSALGGSQTSADTHKAEMELGIQMKPAPSPLVPTKTTNGRAREPIDESALALEMAVNRIQYVGGVSLREIVEDPEKFFSLQRFLQDHCIIRNFNFWLACEYFRYLPSCQLQDVAQAIYDMFISISAPEHVTFRKPTKRHIGTTLELRRQLTPQFFETAQREIEEMIEGNELQQFLTSDKIIDFPEVTMPGINVCGGGSLQVTDSEESLSWFSTGAETRSEQLVSTIKPATRKTKSDTASQVDPRPHLTRFKQVSRDWFVAMVNDRLRAVQKDRDAMQTTTMERAQEQGKSDSEIMEIEWYDHPEASKYKERHVPELETSQKAMGHVHNQAREVVRFALEYLTVKNERETSSDSGLDIPKDEIDQCSLETTSSVSTKSQLVPLKKTPHHRIRCDFKQLTIPAKSRTHHLHKHQQSLPPITAKHQEQDTEVMDVLYYIGRHETPYKKKIQASQISLGVFKKKVFARKGDYRYFFRTFCEDLDMELMMEYTDNAATLPRYKGKLVGHIEKII